ncbi:MAG: hypothetical protein JKY94_14620 [Rhodobacteraceae bacterium]|nr:hypothetical protein [Paracoccaceae bacterium]
MKSEPQSTKLVMPPLRAIARYWLFDFSTRNLMLNPDCQTRNADNLSRISMINPAMVTEPPHLSMGIQDGHFQKTSKSMPAAAIYLTKLDNCE